MNARELMESGIIEAYCLGMASAEEAALVNHFAQVDNAVRDELEAIANALVKYAAAHAVVPSDGVKQRILAENGHQAMAPLLTSESSVEEWLGYLQSNKVFEPEHYEGIHAIDLPSNDTQYTFAAWANQGDRLPDEVHTHEEEYLLICSGECEMTVEGKKTQHKRGDLITINRGKVHSVLVTGKETMLVIVQRRAA